MKDYLLVALQKYASRPNSNPLENFTTEAFCWLLRNDKTAENSFLNMIKGNNQSLIEEIFTWETQHHLKNGGIPDILGTSNNYIVVIEIKVWSGGNDNQLKNYVEELKKDRKEVVDVLLTAGKHQHNIDASVKLIWEEIYSSLKEIQTNNEEGIFRGEFIGFLESQGLFPMKINPAVWFYGKNVMQANDFLISYFKDNLSGRIKRNEISFPLEGFDILNPSAYYYWGRIGIQFKRFDKKPDAEWNPALFFGFIIDPEYLKYNEFLQEGTVFGLIIDVGKNHWSKYSTPDWNIFSEKLKTNAENKGWKYKSTINQNPNNKWHPIIVYKKMTDLLTESSGTLMVKSTDIEQTIEGLIKELIEILNMDNTIQKFISSF